MNDAADQSMASVESENPFDLESMQPEQRIDAVATILARGVKRLRAADLSLPVQPAVKDPEFSAQAIAMTGQTSVIGDRGLQDREVPT